MSGGRLERAALARLADADAAIPDLALAIDEHALARALSRARPDLDVRRIERRYTRYKPATSCLSLFEIELGDGGATTHSVKAYGDAVADKAERVGVDGASVFAVGERAIVSRFPHDAKLPSLAALLDPAARGGVLASALGDGDRWGATTLAPLAYKPERRFVARVENANGERVALKLHASQRHRDASRKLISLASRDGLRLPERLVSSHGDGLVATTWLEGELASDAIARASFDPRALGRVGRALAVLQRQDPKHVPVVRPRERAAALLAMPDALAALDGPLSERARRLAERLAARIASTPADAVPVHGDFYAKQVLLGDDDVAFLDLDAAARGGEAQDAGCFAAHLDRDVVRGRLPLPRAEAARAALLEGLSLELGRGVDARLEHAVALFSLLADPFRRNEEEWLEQTRELLEFAREIEARLPTVAAAASGARRALRRRAAAPAAPAASAAHDGAGLLDPAMPALDAALDPKVAAAAIETTAFPHGDVEVERATLVRHKPGRRALVDYLLALRDPTTGETLQLRALGKLRHKRTDFAAHRLAGELARRGFDGRDGVRVPRSLGVVPDLAMWLQTFEDGARADALLTGGGGIPLAGDIAAALARLHAAAVPAARRHDLAREIAILREQLSDARRAAPALARRIDGVERGCVRLAERIAPARATGIHRDLHPEQVLVRRDGGIVLLDLDLFAWGDPLIDVANFAAHLVELGVREHGDAAALDDARAVFEETWLRLQAHALRRDLERHRALAIARHVAISQRIPARRATTEAVLAAAEGALAAERVL